MAQINVLVCDGCEMAATSRRPVFKFELNVVEELQQVSVIHADAHDWNCFGRVISRRRKVERDAKAAEKPAGKKSKK